MVEKNDFYHSCLRKFLEVLTSRQIKHNSLKRPHLPTYMRILRLEPGVCSKGTKRNEQATMIETKPRSLRQSLVTITWPFSELLESGQIRNNHMRCYSPCFSHTGTHKPRHIARYNPKNRHSGRGNHLICWRGIGSTINYSHEIYGIAAAGCFTTSTRLLSNASDQWYQIYKPRLLNGRSGTFTSAFTAPTSDILERTCHVTSCDTIPKSALWCGIYLNFWRGIDGTINAAQEATIFWITTSTTLHFRTKTRDRYDSRTWQSSHPFPSY